MRKYFRIFFFFFTFIIGSKSIVAGQNVFFEKYPESKNTVTETYLRLFVLQDLPNEQGKIIYSIVAPEVAMYESFLDLMETGAAEIFYANMGGEYGNFSLGIFQMKPSFAERIEGNYKKFCKRGKYLNRLGYSHDLMMEEIRAERIDRLKSEEWQQIYLICFYEIMEVKYANTFPDLRKKISFYAAAYNYGFQSSFNEIRKWEMKVSFPGRTEKSIISYSELAVDFLELMVENISTYIPQKEVATNKVVSDTVVVMTEPAMKDETQIAKTKIKNKSQGDDYSKNGFEYRWLFLLLIIPIVFLIRKQLIHGRRK